MLNIRFRQLRLTYIITGMKRTVVMIVLDGWGIGRNDESNPIYSVKPDQFAWLEANYPVTSLQASGISVGLPWGEVGNSEVGHLTLGAGKVIYQYYPKITISIQDGSFFKNEVIKAACDHAKKNNGSLNLVGLLSIGNVHSSFEHLEALLKFAEAEQVPVKLHLFADGKDSPPRLLPALLAKLPQEKLATLVGRYYAMDREGNWQLTEETYKTLTGGYGFKADKGPDQAIAATYARGLSEEFLAPVRFGGEEKNIAENDAAFFFNFREDSIRQLAESFINPDFDKFPVKKFANLFVATMTPYKETFTAPTAFLPDKVVEPLGKVLADTNCTQLRLAETYKYAHVTYFFNGYKETPFKNEYRVLIPSEAIPHPDEHPQMMAPAITDRLIQAIEGHAFDFILVNYANPDTIAHSGNLAATEEAIRVINREIGRVLQVAIGPATALIITSDHGNAEQLVNPATGKPETQHDPNPVPFYLIAEEFKGKKFINQDNRANETGGILADAAPTILSLLGLPKPPEMDGHDLLKDLV